MIDWFLRFHIGLGDKMQINVVYATNEKYAPHASVSIASLILNSDCTKEYSIMVLHTDLKEQTIAQIQSMSVSNVNVVCLNVKSYVDGWKDSLYSHSYYSDEMYYRMLIPEIFQYEGVVLYLDCDTVVRKDISDYVNFDLGDSYVAGVLNIMHPRMKDYVLNLQLNPEEYINSGVLIFNCKFCRPFVKSFFTQINNYRNLKYPDQDLLNIVSKGKIHYLDGTWNYLWHIERLFNSADCSFHPSEDDMIKFNKSKQNIIVMHFSGDKKPWIFNGIPSSELYWSYAKLSPFYDTIYTNFKNTNEKLHKIKLEDIEYRSNTIIIKCSNNNFNKYTNERIVYCVGDRKYDASYSHQIKSSASNVILYKNIFYIHVDDAPYIEISIERNSKLQLFEYAPSFPLNGNKESYFTLSKYLVKRAGRKLIFLQKTIRRNITCELRYLLSLVESKDCFAKHSVLYRLIYFTALFNKREIWLLSDRPDVGGDNAEALFNYIIHNERKVSVFFVISERSDDYKRIKKIGPVIKVGSLRHKAMYIISNVIAVSQTNSETYRPIFGNYIKDFIFKKKRVFLQHGVTKDDVSGVYSKYYQNMDIFITVSEKEQDSIISNPRYGLEFNNVPITGFPRHDLLLNDPKKIIIISPTWRKYLLKDVRSQTIVDHFQESDYYVYYHSLFNDKKLMESINKYGYKIKYVPHDLMEKSNSFFINDNVEVVGRHHRNYSSLLSEGAILVSDYSSNSFEFAYMHKPVIYFHFDANLFFDNHTYEKGYFNYTEDGFGEVVYDVESLVNLLIDYMASDCKLKEPYASRVTSFYKFDDKNNSRRVFEYISKFKK